MLRTMHGNPDRTVLRSCVNLTIVAMNPGILCVGAVRYRSVATCAGCQPLLISYATNVVEHNSATPCSKVIPSVGNSTCCAYMGPITLLAPFAVLYINVPYFENPSCLHATVASCIDQLLSQIVPHVFFTQTCKVPSLLEEPPTNLISPSVHFADERCVHVCECAKCMCVGACVWVRVYIHHPMHMCT